MGIIHVLWLRQMKRYLRSRVRIISSLGQPLLFLLAFGFGFGPMYAKAGGGNYMQFIAPGIITMSVMFTAIATGIEVIWDRQFGFLKETLVAPVSRFAIMIGRTLGGATVAAMQGALVFLICLIVGFRPVSIAMIPLALLFLFMIGLLFSAFGTTLASNLEDMQAFPLIMNFIVMPIFFLSGALFPLDELPAGIAIITRLNPLSYGVDAMRGTLIASSHFGLLTDFAVLFGVTLMFGALGSYLFSKIQV